MHQGPHSLFSGKHTNLVHHEADTFIITTIIINAFKGPQ